MEDKYSQEADIFILSVEMVVLKQIHSQHITQMQHDPTVIFR